MDKEDKQIIDRAVKEEWRIGDRTRLKRLLEKNLKLYRENVELENKIADIKANCDLAIEGRDVKIMELEESNKELKKLVQQREQRGLEVQEDLLKEKADLEKENAELKRDKKDLIFVRNAKSDHINELKDQLTKAKEHIRTLISCLIDWVQEGDKDYCYIADAEQFLKEIEK